MLISVCEHTHMFNFIQFQHMQRFLYPLQQTQYTTAPWLPGALLLPIDNHTLLLPAQPLQSYLLATTNLVSFSIILLFQNCFVNEIIEILSFINRLFHPAALPWSLSSHLHHWLFFLLLSSIHGMYVQCISLFIYSWTRRLFPVLSYSE